jgi:sucrose phosphorylase
MGRPGEDDLDLKIKRFLCSQAIPLALRGMPAIYIHSLLATSNDIEALQRLGYPRAINRHKWDEDVLRGKLKNKKSQHARVLAAYKHLLAIRREHSAFHPDAPQHVHDLDDAVFAVARLARDTGSATICLHNLTDQPQTVRLPGPTAQRRNLLRDDAQPSSDEQYDLAPYEVAWLAAV